MRDPAHTAFGIRFVPSVSMFRGRVPFALHAALELITAVVLLCLLIPALLAPAPWPFALLTLLLRPSSMSAKEVRRSMLISRLAGQWAPTPHAVASSTVIQLNRCRIPQSECRFFSKMGAAVREV